MIDEWRFSVVGLRFSAVVALLTCVSSTAFAAGFAVADQGPAASGMANAATARFDLAEGAYFNPAGSVVHAGGAVALGTAVVLPSLTHTSPTSGISTGAQTGATTVPAAHASYTFDEPRLSIVGYAGVPFGSGIEWSDDWIGRFEVTKLSLRVFETGLNVGYGMTFGEVTVGVAAGPRLLLSDVELTRQVDAVDSEGSVRIVGDARTVSGQASLAVDAGFVRFGASYRPRATLEYSGQADFEDIPIELAGRARDQDVSTEVTLPDRIAFGAAANLFGVWLLSVDLEFFMWSTFESFGVDFSAEETPDVDQPRNWSNTFAFRLGNELDFDLHGVVFRAGFAWDPTPGSPEYLSPASPDSDRAIVTAGVGWRSDFGLQFDAAFAQVFLADQTSEGEAFPGEYSGSANVLNVGATFRF